MGIGAGDIYDKGNKDGGGEGGGNGGGGRTLTPADVRYIIEDAVKGSTYINVSPLQNDDTVVISLLIGEASAYIFSKIYGDSYINTVYDSANGTLYLSINVIQLIGSMRVSLINDTGSVGSSFTWSSKFIYDYINNIISNLPNNNMLNFAGYVSATDPSTGGTLKNGTLWLESGNPGDPSSGQSTFTAQQWNSTTNAWVQNYAYTPGDWDIWYNSNDESTWYFFANSWHILNFSIDLSNYYTKPEISTLLSQKAANQILLNQPTPDYGWYPLALDNTIDNSSSELKHELVQSLGYVGFAPTVFGWLDITFGNGTYVAITGDSDAVAYSSDGKNWIIVENALPATNPRTNWKSVAFGNGVFVAVGAGNPTLGTATYGYSTDGMNWTAGTLPSYIWNPLNAWYVVRYCPSIGKFVAMSYYTSATSADGINWTAGNLSAGRPWRSLADNSAGLIIAVAGDLSQAGSISAYYIYSSDGLNWTQAVFPTYATGSYLNVQSIAYGNGQWVAVGGGHAQGTAANVCYVSTDGINWNIVQFFISGIWSAAVIGNGFVATALPQPGSPAMVIATPFVDNNPSNWILRQLGSIAELGQDRWQPQSGVYANGVFTFVASNEVYGAFALANLANFTYSIATNVGYLQDLYNKILGLFTLLNNNSLTLTSNGQPIGNFIVGANPSVIEIPQGGGVVSNAALNISVNNSTGSVSGNPYTPDGASPQNINLNINPLYFTSSNSVQYFDSASYANFTSIPGQQSYYYDSNGNRCFWNGGVNGGTVWYDFAETVSDSTQFIIINGGTYSSNIYFYNVPHNIQRMFYLTSPLASGGLTYLSESLGAGLYGSGHSIPVGNAYLQILYIDSVSEAWRFFAGNGLDLDAFGFAG